MIRRDIIVIGGSAGGVEALMHICAGLPADLPAAVFVVEHISPRSRVCCRTCCDVRGRCPPRIRWMARQSSRATSMSRRPIVICCCATAA